MLNGHHSADAVFTYGEKKSLSAERFAKYLHSKYMLRKAEIYPWFAP